MVRIGDGSLIILFLGSASGPSTEIATVLTDTFTEVGNWDGKFQMLELVLRNMAVEDMARVAWDDLVRILVQDGTAGSSRTCTAIIAKILNALSWTAGPGNSLEFPLESRTPRINWETEKPFSQHCVMRVGNASGYLERSRDGAIVHILYDHALEEHVLASLFVKSMLEASTFPRQLHEQLVLLRSPRARALLGPAVEVDVRIRYRSTQGSKTTVRIGPLPHLFCDTCTRLKRSTKRSARPAGAGPDAATTKECLSALLSDRTMDRRFTRAAVQENRPGAAPTCYSIEILPLSHLIVEGGCYSVLQWFKGQGGNVDGRDHLDRTFMAVAAMDEESVRQVVELGAALRSQSRLGNLLQSQLYQAIDKPAVFREVCKSMNSILEVASKNNAATDLLNHGAGGKPALCCLAMVLVDDAHRRRLLAMVKKYGGSFHIAVDFQGRGYHDECQGFFSMHQSRFPLAIAAESFEQAAIARNMQNLNGWRRTIVALLDHDAQPDSVIGEQISPSQRLADVRLTWSRRRGIVARAVKEALTEMGS